MSSGRRNIPRRHRIDLATVRETLAYMHGDMAHVPELEAVRRALGNAIAEVDAAGHAEVSAGGARHLVDVAGGTNVVGLAEMRFEKWQPPR